MIRPTLPTPVRRAPLLAVASALVLLAGCGGTDGAKTVTVGAGATRPAGSASPATKADRAWGPRPEPAVVAGRTGTVDDEPVLLQIVGLRRSGRTVSLSLRLTTKSDVYVFID